jgi:hypothetical protein
VSSNLAHGDVYSIYIIYVLMIVSDLNCGRSVVFSTNETDGHDITEILLKVALNTNLFFVLSNSTVVSG